VTSSPSSAEKVPDELSICAATAAPKNTSGGHTTT
jgi:hypothetical protein